MPFLCSFDDHLVCQVKQRVVKAAGLFVTVFLGICVDGYGSVSCEGGQDEWNGGGCVGVGVGDGNLEARGQPQQLSLEPDGGACLCAVVDVFVERNQGGVSKQSAGLHHDEEDGPDPGLVGVEGMDGGGCGGRLWVDVGFKHKVGKVAGESELLHVRIEGVCLRGDDQFEAGVSERGDADEEDDGGVHESIVYGHGEGRVDDAQFPECALQMAQRFVVQAEVDDGIPRDPVGHLLSVSAEGFGNQDQRTQQMVLVLPDHRCRNHCGWLW